MASPPGAHAQERPGPVALLALHVQLRAALPKVHDRRAARARRRAAGGGVPGAGRRPRSQTVRPLFPLLPLHRLFTGFTGLACGSPSLPAPPVHEQPARAAARALWGSLRLDSADSAPTDCTPGCSTQSPSPSRSAGTLEPVETSGFFGRAVSTGSTGPPRSFGWARVAVEHCP